MTRRVWILCLIYATYVRGQSVSVEVAEAYANSWLGRNPLVLRQQQVQGLPLKIRRTEPCQLSESHPPFYLIHLNPQGYIVMNSDRRLRPVVCFDFSGSLDLERREDNTVYQLLLRHVERNLQGIASGTPALSVWDIPSPVRILSSSEDEVISPMLATSWDQGNHYNEYCPVAPEAPKNADGRAPTGCVATAFAQIMKYHEWPYRGIGSFTYEDMSGTITGTHTANFSEPYEWQRMQNEYYAFGYEPNEAVHAVSKLMHDLGVAAKMDYEPASSQADAAELASRIRKHFLYETPLLAASLDTKSFTNAVLGDLVEHRPCIATIPGHAFVIDGHMRQEQDDFFYVNYGWSGQNDGWYVLDDIHGQAITEVCTGIKPLLVAIPRGSEWTAQGLELRWVLPETRIGEVTGVDVLKRGTVAGTFADPADTFNLFEVTSTSNYKDWILSSPGYTGACFYKPAGGYRNRQYHLTSSGVFRPSQSTSLTFKAKYSLFDDGLSILVSTNDGDSFSPVWSVSKAIQMNWTDIQISLGAFSGQDIRVRLEYTTGDQFYVNGGVWIDEIQLVAAQWYEWSVIHHVHELNAYRAESTTTFRDEADAFTIFKVTSTDHKEDWSLSPDGHTGTCFYKPAGGYSNADYHLTSTRSFRPGSDTQLTFKTKYALAEDMLSVLVSSGSGGGFSTVWSVSGTVRRNWTDIQIPLGMFAGQDVLIRFKYTPGRFFLTGGVWIDEIRLIDVTGADYLACPVYYTALPNPGKEVDILAYQVRAGDQIHPRSETFTTDVGASD